MPEEFSRTTKNKLINLPNGGTVLVPVISQISFIDPIKGYQEYQFSVDNSGQADREVHVDDVFQDGGSGGSPLKVERIDVWKYVDPVQRYQEKQVSFDNTTKGDVPPPYFTTHTKTHVVRYTNSPDDGNFIDSELIDEFSIIDPQRQYQEYAYTLLNPDGASDGQGHMIVTANSDDPVLNDSGNGVDPPWRTDPFQNIVNWHSGGPQFFEQIFVFRRYGDSCADANAAALAGMGGGDWYPVSRELWLSWAGGSTAHPDGQTSPADDPGHPGSSIVLMQSIAFRTNLSDLISACTLLSKQAGQSPGPLDSPPPAGGNEWNPWFAWNGYTGQPQLTCSGFPTPLFDVNQPSASNASVIDPNGKPHFIYLGVKGGYSMDDTPTGGFDLSSVPPFTPPT